MVTHFLQSTTVRGTNLNCALWNVSDATDIPSMGLFCGLADLLIQLWYGRRGPVLGEDSFQYTEHSTVSVRCVLAHSLYKNGMVLDEIAGNVWMEHTQWPCSCSSTFGLRLW